MTKTAAITRYFCVVFCIMVLTSEVINAAPKYMDIENFQKLYELLLEKDAFDEQMNHQMVRKSAPRSPSLRLRFGRRSDPLFAPSLAQTLDMERNDN